MFKTSRFTLAFDAIFNWDHLPVISWSKPVPSGTLLHGKVLLIEQRMLSKKTYSLCPEESLSRYNHSTTLSNYTAKGVGTYWADNNGLLFTLDLVTWNLTTMDFCLSLTLWSEISSFGPTTIPCLVNIHMYESRYKKKQILCCTTGIFWHLHLNI